MREVCIAMAQVESVLGEVEVNLQKLKKYISDAAKSGVELVVFPELVLTGYNLELLGSRVSEFAKKSSYAIKELQNAANEHNIAVVTGLSMEKEVPGIVYNSAIVIDANGELLGSYDKVNAFGLERFYYRKGSQFPIFTLKNGFKFGVMICYDAGFPEVARILALKGAEAIICPAAWRSEDDYYWDLNLKSRGMDNLIPVVGVNRVGTEHSLSFFGGSKVINSKGHVISEMNDEEGIQVVRLDLDEYLETRKTFQHMMDLRTELYASAHVTLSQRN